jgi:hypothetical protein
MEEDISWFPIGRARILGDIQQEDKEEDDAAIKLAKFLDRFDVGGDLAHCLNNHEGEEMDK